jgi:[histone H3]-lysine36 N-trimethyltransferase
MLVECVIDASGSCGDNCQNQRFQRKQYANVSVIKTDKKGYGLRANAHLEANEFVWEYIGEVVNEPTFRRRMRQYDEEGIKHFYFMSLTKSEFIDATKKGNLGRFCNHSCNPNCYVDKWVVGEKVRMGIFAKRNIQAGEELTFDYNVDRYGADPQACYCGESICVGFIGGKTQTGRSVKLDSTVVEALGIDVDGWDATAAKKPRKKRADEDDEEYVNSVQAKSLGIDDARKVMAVLMQGKEKWLTVKLLERIQRCEEDRVLNEVLRMHGYEIMKKTLINFGDEDNIILQVLDILDRFPRLTRNKIADSNIEATVGELAKSVDVQVAGNAQKLLDDWAKLDVGFRIKRRKIDPNAQQNYVPASEALRSMVLGRDEKQQTPEPTKSPLPNVEIPKGPRNSAPQRIAFSQMPRVHAQHLRQPAAFFAKTRPLPAGWFQANDAKGQTYFYNRSGETQWTRPTEPPVPQGPKQPTKAERDAQILQSIIDQATRERPKPAVPNNAAASSTPSEVATPRAKESRRDSWKSLPIEKQMKVYRNTVRPHLLSAGQARCPLTRFLDIPPYTAGNQQVLRQAEERRPQKVCQGTLREVCQIRL